MANELFKEFPPVSTEDWEKQINTDLKGGDYEKKLVWKTTENFSVRPYYRLEHLQALEYLKSLPGNVPYVRGKNKTSNHWEIREDIFNSTISSANELALSALTGGAESITFHTTVEGNEVKGVPIQKEEDMKSLLKDIHIEMISTNFEAGNASPAILGMFVNEVKTRRLNSSDLKGSIGYDPLIDLAKNGKLNNNTNTVWENTKDLVSYTKTELPKFKSITVHGSHFHNSGSTIIQELGFALSMGNEYLTNLSEKGVDVDDGASSIQFEFAISSNYFLEIAKFRAARMLWSNILTAHKSSKIPPMTIHGVVSEWNKTMYDPHVNLLRGTTESMSAAIGGCDSVSITHFDSTYSEGDEFSHRISRNIQNLLKHESHLDKVIDPSAGSYYIETLTDSIAKNAWAVFQTVESKGGYIAALKEGFIQTEIEKSKSDKSKNLATRGLILLGTNQYPLLKDTALEKVNKKTVTTKLATTSIKPSNKNMSAITSSVHTGCTLGDILNFTGSDSDINVTPIKTCRGAEIFETVRLKTENYKSKKGHAPRVFLVQMGNLGMRIARATFTTNFFGCAGFAIQENPAFNSVEEAANKAVESQSEIVVLCSSDEEYVTIASDITKQIKSKNPKQIVVVAGNPKDIMDKLKADGVDGFIHVRSNVLEELQSYQSKLGI